MNERPILFSAPMVKALLDGRKTQTRRLLKPQPTWLEANVEQGLPAYWCWDAGYTGTDDRNPRFGMSFNSYGMTERGFAECIEACADAACPYGAAGDRLWVRETWAETTNVLGQKDWPGRPHISNEVDPDGINQTVVIWRADGPWQWCDGDGFFTEKTSWKPSTHMPRWASRITLEITGIWVERLQDIRDADAMAEGVVEPPLTDHPWPTKGGPKEQRDWVGAFVNLWESINGPGSWEANPWVWVVEFRRVEA